MARNNVLDKKLIEQYMNVTGTDETVAKSMLEAFEGNLESAINMYLEGSPAISSKRYTSNLKSTTSSSASAAVSTTSSSRTSSSAKSETNLNASEDDVRAPIPQQQAILVDDKYHALPYNPRQHRQGTTNSIFDNCRDFKKETEEYSQMLSNKSSRNRKKKRLHELFRPPVDILHEGDFQSARDASKHKSKWLLVNIQNSVEFPCQILNRDVWSHKIVREIINENFVLWQQAYDSDAGLHYSTFYPVNNHPHISIIDPRTGERMVVWENLGMKPSADQFAELATMFLSEHPNLNQSFEHERRKRESSNSTSCIIDCDEDEQLNAAIKASLHETSTSEKNTVSAGSDGDSDALFSDDEIPPDSKKRKTESEDSKCTNGEITAEETPSLESRPPVDEYLNEDSNLSAVSSKSDAETAEKVRILLRLPDNGRKQITLNYDNTLKELSEEVTRLGWPNKKYELIKSFPRQNISELDSELTLKKAGLHKQETLFIQDR
ncbi:UBX domain-containing protein 7-like [Hydractinia symbiolongicarpus]|uniref:UBX domain-containing protein 7-like n=1 Tax=Hydractinia symbiolongicarpus TaxID=13093 RepID=UPI00254BC646|nr:UBX domain-containing protein 7-like [Hydractinia symbiolongicarpus]